MALKKIMTDSFHGPYGYVDLPVVPSDGPDGKDRLNVEAYYNGLASFVAECQTPMTVAIQGDWGSGKSTALNFVKAKLQYSGSNSSRKPSVHVIEFNTWLYSQFDLGDSLVFSLAHEILRPISKSSGTAKKLMRFVATMGAGVFKGSADTVGALTGTSLMTSAIVEALKNATYSDDAPNVIAELREIHQLFATSVEEYCNANNVDRIAILIDDLDRVEPSRAISILESLKLFFEVPRCVFVLAVDFDVVVRGVEERYGTEFKKKKARQYFDKIIQVPFAMPVASFHIDGILREALTRSGVLGRDDDEDFARYLKVVRDSVGTNPRSVKRLLNSFELLQLILKSQNTPLTSAERRLPLLVFALLCAQATYPELHRRLIEERGPEGDLDAVLTDKGDEEDVTVLAEGFDLEPVDVRTFRAFRENLGVLSTRDGDQLELEILRQAIVLSQVTAVGGARFSDSEDDGKAVGSDGAVESVRSSSTEYTTELVKALTTSLYSKLQQRDFSMAAQDVAKQITLYTSKDIDQFLKLGPRGRPRFAAIGYSRKGLSVTFGRGSDSKQPNGGQPYGPEWNDLVPVLEQKFPEDGGPSGAVFHIRKQGYPFYLDGITKLSGIDQIVDSLMDIYDVVQKYREKGE